VKPSTPPRHLVRAALVLTTAAAALLSAASPAAAIFRFDEVERRNFEYTNEYFMNLLAYRPRLSHRWRWSQSAVGYRITAGSVRTSELYVDQRAIVRIPWSNHLVGEYRFVETEDYDARYLRNEVEVKFRFFRPEWRPDLLDTFGRTPPPDGLFFGGLGLLDADKEFADLGFALGYGEELWGVRLDLWNPDFFFNGKNRFDAEYETAPLTLKGSAYGSLPGARVDVSAFVEYDAPLELMLPAGQDLVFERQDLEFRYEQLQGGFNVRWWAGEGVRVDVEVWGELTSKERRSSDAALVDDLDREALKAWGQVEVDVAPVLGEEWSSRTTDVAWVGLHGHVLREDTDRLLDRTRDITIHRGEAFFECGYVAGLPSPGPEYEFGARFSGQFGFGSLRDVRPEIGRHRVTERILALVGVGFEATFLDGLGFAFGQFTFRLDEPEFGGGNVQVMMRF